MRGAVGTMAGRLTAALRWRAAKVLKGSPLQKPLRILSRTARDLRHRAIARRPDHRRHDDAQRAALADWLRRQGLE